jgi:hypothetical protein
MTDALTGRLTEVHRFVLRLLLQQIDQIEQHVIDLDRALAQALAAHQETVERLCEIPGISVRTAQYLIAELDPAPSLSNLLASSLPWVVICPGVPIADACQDRCLPFHSHSPAILALLLTARPERFRWDMLRIATTQSHAGSNREAEAQVRRRDYCRFGIEYRRYRQS